MQAEHRNRNVPIRRNPLGWIFEEPLEANPAEQTNNFQLELCKFLSLKDLKTLRTVNSFCHRFVSLSPSFGSKVNCKISERWHRDFAGGLGLTYGTNWRYFTFEHFAYHRNHPLFQRYWSNSSKFMVELTFAKCSLECDALAFILNECTILKSLTFQEVKLKHWGSVYSAVHRSLPALAGNEGHQRDSDETKAMCRCLKTLSFSKMKNIRDCVMAHLTERSGGLETLVVNDCFPEAVIPELAAAQNEEYTRFENNLVQILNANRNTIKELVIQKNFNQSQLLTRLGNEMRRINVENNYTGTPIRKIDVTASEPEFGGLQILMGSGITPEHFTLRLNCVFTEQQLLGFVSPLAGTVKNFKLLFNGGELSSETGNLLDLSRVLQRFRRLESVAITDVKEVNDVLLRRAKGEKPTRKTPIPTEDVRQDSKNALRSSLDSRMLLEIPRTTREISMQAIIFPDATTSDMDWLKGFPGYRQLIKLEIIGPLVNPISNFRMIPMEMKRLKTLVLVDCGLSDAAITGLSRDATHEMRKCGTHMLSMLLPTKDGGEDAAKISHMNKFFNRITRDAKMYSNQMRPIDRETPILRNNRVADARFIYPETDDASDEEDMDMDDHQDNDGPANHGAVEHDNDVEMAVLEQNDHGNGDQGGVDLEPPPVFLDRGHIYMLKDLEHLDFSKNYEVTDVTVYDSIKNKNLKVLKLEHCPRITDFTLDHISKFHPNLETLHVKGCRRLSMYGFNQVIERCPRLQRIYTTKKIAETDFDEMFEIPVSPSYHDIVHYPDMDTRRAPAEPPANQPGQPVGIDPLNGFGDDDDDWDDDLLLPI